MRYTLAPRQWKQRTSPPHLPLIIHSKKKLRLPRIHSKRLLVRLLVIIAFLAFLPFVVFHFRLRWLQKMRTRRCSWLENPPLVCAHGGDSSRSAPNSVDAYHIAIQSEVDCIEIDVSRTSDGTLFALHDRDLQRMSGNDTLKVGFMKSLEIKKLEAGLNGSTGKVPTIHEALKFVSSSVKQVILDVKVGPPLFEEGLAKDVISVVQRSGCSNYLIWAKSDILSLDVMKLTEKTMVGYIVMRDPVTGATSNLLRMKNASVVGVYHMLINNSLVQILHGAGKKVYAWTVDDVDSMQKLLFERVDAIVTSYPTLLKKVMQKLEAECREEGFALP
ncbi:hypothetical protein HPP92_019449 [Vanilla planifolia]|uniref:glycerophosphodiester phosphodiesterase n=1 Tax=Vanilla planifolia TaxID=51239 RepID=A0A835Q372_VANPL|nr:hypothetical protein HPP92_019449 [Vanilla planifolia]